MPLRRWLKSLPSLIDGFTAGAMTTPSQPTGSLPRPSAFRDRKRLGWLLSVIGPGLAEIGRAHV